MTDSVVPKRKNIRLKNYDYGSNGCYFVTICVKDKQHLLAHYKSKEEIVGAGLRARPQDAIMLTPLGRDVLWQRRYYDRIIRNQSDFEYHWNYIEYNALKEYSNIKGDAK